MLLLAAVLAALLAASPLALAEAPAPAEPTPTDRTPADEAPKDCGACEAWNQPRTPVRLWGDSWFVGPDGLSVVVVRTSAGLVLLDGALPQSVEPVVARLASLGLAATDIRYLLTSHAHYDHVGGVAALQRRSGAVVVTSAAAEPVLRAGRVPADDPQAGQGADAMAFPPVVGPIQTLADGQTLVVGDTTFTAIATPGHTPGGLSWTWTACEDAGCAHVVYADSLNPVSADTYRFTDHPELLADFRASIARIAALPCDVLVPVHPGFGRFLAEAERAERKGGGDQGPREQRIRAALLDPRACQRYAADAGKRLEKRVREEARDGR